MTLLLPLLLPAAFGVLVLLVPRRAAPLRSALGIAGALAAFVSSLSLLGTAGTWSGGGFPIGPLDLVLVLTTDAFSSWAVPLATLMALAATLYALAWHRGRGGAPGRFYGWLLLATAGAVAVLLAGDLLLLVVGWEIVTLSLFLLVLTGREEGADGAVRAFATLGFGDTALLVGVVLLGVHQATVGVDAPFSIAALRSAPLATGGGLGLAAYLLLLVAAMTKAGAMPFHGWIPSIATGTNASVMAFLPGSLDKVLGIFLLVRISIDWFAPTDGLRMLVMSAGVVTMLGAVFMALIQHDLRRLLSFHAVSQVGYMLLGIGTGTVIGVIGGVFHMVNNAIYKACLFLGAGEVERETGTSELDRLGGLARTFPVTFGAMFVAALAISGIPPLNGFASKWLVYQSCVAAGVPLFLVAAIFASALTLASFVKVLHSVFWGACPAHLDGAREEASLGIRLPLIVLAVLCVLLGVFAAGPLDHAFGPVAGLEPGGTVSGADALASAPATLAPVGDATASTPATPWAPARYAPGLITVLLVFGTLVALFLGYLGNLRWRRTRSVFVGGEPLDRNLNRFPGTEFYRTIGEVPVLSGVLDAAERGTLDPYRGVGRIGRPVVAMLRRLHTGRATDYLGWCLAGLALVFVVLVLGR